jgi:hypothetical protein
VSDHGELRRLDREARLLARKEFVRPVALEAGAGTGKTATLVQRIVAWCLGHGFERHRGAGGSVPERVLQRLVAITFTEAAAAEMSARVGRAFAELGAGRGPVGLAADELAGELGLSGEQLAERARAFAEASQHLRLSTIHSFAAELLFEAPLEAGLHPRPTIDAEGEALRRAARETVEAELAVALGPEPNPAWLHLAQQGFGPAEIEAELVRLLTLGVEPARQQTLGIEAEGLQSLGVEQLELPARALSLAGFQRWRAAVLEALEPLHRKLGAPGIKWSRSKRGPKIQDGLAFLRAQLAEPAGNAGQASERLERLRTEPRLSELEKLLRTAWAKGDFNGEERKQLSDLAGIEEAAGRLARELAALRGFDHATGCSPSAPRCCGASASASTSCWWTSSRTPTSASATWWRPWPSRGPRPPDRACSWSATPSNRSTPGAKQTWAPTSVSSSVWWRRVASAGTCRSTTARAPRSWRRSSACSSPPWSRSPACSRPSWPW